jgi:hypothetical protein
MSLKEDYLKLFKDASSDQEYSTLINGLMADVTMAVGKGQRQGLRDTALAMGYKLEDRGSIVEITKQLIAAVEKKLTSTKKQPSH